MKKYVTALFATVFLIGCAAYQPPKEYKFDKERVIAKNYDDTWGRVIQWFGTKGVPIKNMEKVSGFISTEYSLTADKTAGIMDCGTAGYAQSIDNYTATFNVIVAKVSDTQTNVTVTTFYKGTVTTANVVQAGGPPHIANKTCNSTGVLETELLDFVSK